MSTLFLGNPSGLWALLTIPAVLAIHFLQPRSRRLITTTLFLLEHLPPLATTGRAWRWLRNSWALWLQLLAVLLLTWLLVEPRWQRPDSIQTIVVLLDASASMQAFRTEAANTLTARALTWERAAARTEWIVRETALERPVLYRGFTHSDALAALARWQPDLGSHDFTPALEVARQVARRHGAAVLLTDRKPTLNLDGVALVTVGRPLENAGFSGGTVQTRTNESPAWKVLVHYHGTAPARRTLTIVARAPFAGAEKSIDATIVRAEELTLEPGRLLTLSGVFPAGIEALEFRLTPDTFALDDALPLVVPVPRPLSWRAIGSENATAFFRRFMERTPGLARAASGTTADVSIYATNTPFDQPVAGANLIELMIYTSLQGGTPATRVATAPVVADTHPWIDGVTWSGLLGPGPAAAGLPPGARALLWQGRQPLAWSETVQGIPRLVLGWDWTASNAERLPASAVLMHRVIEDARHQKFAPETTNVDTGQALRLPPEPTSAAAHNSPSPPWTWHGPDGTTRAIAREETAALRAPGAPGFFEIRRGGQVVTRGAAHFADPRETDFAAAASLAEPAELALDVTQANSERDHLRPVWLLLLVGVLLGSWAAVAPRQEGVT